MARDVDAVAPDPLGPFVSPTTKPTEDLIALAFVEANERTFAFDHDRGKWFRFDGSVWRLCGKPEAFHKIRELSRLASLRTGSQATLQKVRFVKGAEEFARNDPRMSRNADSWNTNPYLLGTPNGTVDLKTGKLRAADSKDLINRATAVPPSPNAHCPRWLKFLEEATAGDPDLILFLRQICGYALTADTREQALFFLHGPGGNGKGVFQQTIEHILADYQATATMEVLTSTRVGGATTDLAMLNGARMVSASETEEGVPWAEAKLKRLTGGDPITARFMRQDNVTFTPVFKLLVSGNHKPSLKSPDEAMRRRFNLIPFIVQPPKKDRTLFRKLEAEWPGILRWMIEGCLDWQANGLQRPQRVVEATESYFEEQDTFRHWLDTRCHVARDRSSSFTPLYQSWKAFAASQGEIPGTGKTFAEALAKNGFSKTRTSKGMEYQGLELRYDHDEDGR